MIIDVKCPFCGKQQQVNMPDKAYAKWKKGACIQHAWPKADASTRELLITGICKECWPDNE